MQPSTERPPIAPLGLQRSLRTTCCAFKAQKTIPTQTLPLTGKGKRSTRIAKALTGNNVCVGDDLASLNVPSATKFAPTVTMNLDNSF